MKLRRRLEFFFRELTKADDLGEHQKVTQLNQKITLLEPALELLMPGLLAVKRTLHGFILIIDRIDQSSPREGITCLQNAFLYTAQRGTNREEWITFLALCNVHVEKWGKQKRLSFSGSGPDETQKRLKLPSICSSTKTYKQCTNT